MLTSTKKPNKIILSKDEINLLSSAVSSYIFSLENMWLKTNEEQYFEELQKVRELKNHFILVKRGLAE